MQRRLDAIDDQCVARVVPTLKTDDTLCTFGQPINQLAFAFVTPLGSDHHYVATFGCFHLKPNSIVNCLNSLHDPAARNLHQFPITVELVHFALMPRQNTNHRLTRRAELDRKSTRLNSSHSSIT